MKVFVKSVDICRSRRQDVLFCALYTVRRPLIYSGRKECSSGHTVRPRSCSLPVSLHKLPRTHFITNAKRFDIWTAPTALSLSPHIQCVLWYKASARLQSLLADYRYGKSMLARVCILYIRKHVSGRRVAADVETYRGTLPNFQFYELYRSENFWSGDGGSIVAEQNSFTDNLARPAAESRHAGYMFCSCFLV